MRTMKTSYLSLLFLCLFAWNAFSTNVTITMNSISRTMTLAEKTSGLSVDTGEPAGYVYNFNVAPGTYVLTGFNTNNVSNGTIEIEIVDADEQTFAFTTITAGAINSGWVLGTDYTVNHISSSREGVVRINTQGTSVTANRVTFLMLIGDSYYVDLIPNEARQAEGFLANHLMATVTSAAVNATGFIPVGYDYEITVPEEATLFVGRKFAHFVQFKEIEPKSFTYNAGKKVYQYFLANGQIYNYRVSQPGKLTNAGYFSMSQSLAPLEITEAMLNSGDPKRIDYDVKSNQGLNVGDILLNVNEKGHLKMNVNDKHRMLSMRSWQLTDNSVNNYFIEPDFHYTVINESGSPDNSVVTVDEKGVITAVGNGTAIVLVTYDAISLNASYTMGREWGAIWPENTGAFVVTVGDATSGIVSNIKINESLNAMTKKMAGDAVDAEHDVFYYLSSTEGYDYTFTPTGVESVTIAYPVIGVQTATYNGFSSEGVTANEDGSYTVRLKHGRNIVKMTSAGGLSEYQVFTAKPTNYLVKNLSNPNEQIQPGDEIAIVFSGLFHPANKLAGIYNMSAYVQFNGIPNGTSLILSANQYTFGSSESAQTVKLTVPSDWNPDVNLELQEGVIQVNGFGDPIGNHRNTSLDFGRSPNFTAVAHKTYFGSLPGVSVDVHETVYYTVNFTNLPEGALVTLYNNKKTVLTQMSENSYTLSFGTYTYEVACTGYKMLRGSFSISSQSPLSQDVQIQMDPIGTNGWDGTTTTQPAIVTIEESNTVGGTFEGMEGYYKISSGYELAWFSDRINNVSNTSSAVLINDIDLCNFAWTPIGASVTSKQFKGTFNGANKTVRGIYIDNALANQALLGYINAATVKNLTVAGNITSTADYVAGVVGRSTGASIIQNCHNQAVISGKTYVAGILAHSNAATLTIADCSNSGSVSATGSYCAGVLGMLTSGAAAYNSTFINLTNSGTITGTSYTSGLLASAGTAKLIENCNNTGAISGTNYVTGVSSYSYAQSGDVLINKCFNSGSITSTAASGYTGGIVGNQNLTSTNQIVVRNCYNTADIQGAGMVGGISGSMHASAVIENSYNAGVISASSGFAGSIKGVTAGIITNVYSLHDNYTDGATVKTTAEFASGEVAWLLGNAFGQNIDTDNLPVLNDAAVYKITYTNNLDAENGELYTNGNLPVMKRAGYTAKWLAGISGGEINEVSADAELYLQFTPDATTGAGNVKPEFTVYPNPFTDYLYIKSNRDQILKITSISGQVLLNVQVHEGVNRVDVSSLPKGTYILNRGSEVFKVVK